MKINGMVHCFFEQSGTFKNEFKKLGIHAEDYDIQNEYGETDHIVDLFAAIEAAYDGLPSLFDNISSDDLIVAFFPCTYFCSNNTMMFDGTTALYHNRGYTEVEINEEILRRGQARQYLLKLFTISTRNGLRMVLENPYAPHHYLHNNFPYKPRIIDYNRQQRGDYYVKPTQYFFHNCSPTFGCSFSTPKENRDINKTSGRIKGKRNKERSEISPDYARNFICDFILGKEQNYTQLTLF